MSGDALRSRLRWPRWLRLFGPLLLAVMLWRVGPSQCWAALRDAQLGWFLAACGLSLPALALKGWRWQRVLDGLGFRFPLVESMGVYAAGSLAGAVTPGKVGDLAKAPLLAARGVPWRASIIASLVDRVFDALVLLAVGLAGIVALPALPGRALLSAVVAGVIGLTVAAAIVYRRHFTAVFHSTGAGWWMLMAATTLAALACYLGSACLCSEALALPLAPTDVAAAAAVAALLALLPVTVGGIGTRDAAFVVLFRPRGVDAEHALALSSLILAWMVVNCVLFLVVARLGRPSVAAQPASSSFPGATSHESVE